MSENEIRRYWAARREFEAALRALSQEALKLLRLTPKAIEQTLADIEIPAVDPPGLEVR